MKLPRWLHFWLGNLLYGLIERLRLVRSVELPQCPKHGAGFFRVVGVDGRSCTRCEADKEVIREP